MKNLWILTEERPKNTVLTSIFEIFTHDNNFGAFLDSIRIIPILDRHGKFTFTYEVIGFKCKNVNKVFIRTVSGESSFVDYLIFYQELMPSQADKPIYGIEVTKTDDSESRNTGVYQRCTKFVLLEKFYPGIKKIMLYDLQVTQKSKPTATNIFGNKLFSTLNINIYGKQTDKNLITSFNNVDELIAQKKSMRKPPKNNVPLNINKFNDRIEISGRLVKYDRLSHDPNIGAITAISAALRKLGWNKKIIVINHGLLSNQQIGKTNKFVQISNNLDIELSGLKIPKCKNLSNYWHYETNGEKLGTIFIHIAVESFTNGYSIFENHAGGEKGYFITPDGTPVALAKYKDKEKYKAGQKDQRISIPDLILIDFDRKTIINAEGKTYSNRKLGISTLANYDYIEDAYVHRYYPHFDIVRTVVLYGSDNEKIMEIEVGFLLNKLGKLILGIRAPEIFIDAINNLLDYWK